ncbi:hypothetical protein G6F33_009912 [Rhizopus arrhizus]|nr:hypothetical protein G6F33_009912 [Rhizopus arrhizus]KAG0940226.1 hypothetical protein G6F32_008846 [Rhizopus arrhizus]
MGSHTSPHHNTSTAMFYGWDYKMRLRLRDHYTTVEGICYPNTKSKTYNTKYRKFISASEARRRKSVIYDLACPSCSDYFEKLEDLAKHLKEKHEPKKRPEVDNGFKKLVENLNDLDIYVKNEVFTPQEIEEIKTYRNAGMGKELPDDFKKYLNKLNCQNSSEVRDVLNETQEWEKSYNRSKSFDLNWIKHSIYTLLREYEDGSFEVDHNEQWYNVHIWGLIDRCFGNVKGVEVVR